MTTSATDHHFKRSVVPFAVLVVALGMCFAVPLVQYAKFAAKSELYSHVFLIPFISAYLAWMRRSQVPSQATRSFAGAAAFAALALTVLGGWWAWQRQEPAPAKEDSLSAMLLAFYLLLVGGSFVTLGRERVRALGFPLAFLVFIVPFPSAVTAGIESFFQHGSAEVSAWLFQLSDTPVIRDGRLFKLPGIVIEVAQECSGIRSSLVLFITCVLAGHLFLRQPWTRVALALAVVPLGLARNALRIFTISMLCVHLDRDYIHSPIHTHGGPLFFLISLAPLFALLWALRKAEGRNFKVQSSRFKVEPPRGVSPGQSEL
ncbi:MAG: exosortase [Verrucomicrobia bacterium]|nr:exosortase [Verrucomicrobiota bacterium]